MSNKSNENESGKSSSDEELRENKKRDGNNEEKRLLKCIKCAKQYTNLKSWKQHIESHIRKRKCNICKEKSFSRLEKLYRHQETVHGVHKEKKPKVTSFKCTICDKTFGRKHHLTRHTTRVHRQRTQRQSMAQFSCRHCDCEFDDYDRLFDHVNRTHPLNQQGGRRATIPPTINARERQLVNGFADTAADTINRNVATDNDEVDKGDVHDEQQPAAERLIDQESALGNGVLNRYIHPKKSERYDMLTFFANIRGRVLDFLQSRARRLGGVKWNLCVQVEMQRDDVNEVALRSPYFRSRTYILLSADDVNEHDLNEAMQKMYASLEKFMREGSGWYLKKVLKLEIHTVVYKPLSGSAYLPLPKSLALSRSILNIQNQDDKCFLYCVIASLHPATTEPELAEHYYPYVGEVDMSGITYPVTLQQINKVENQNGFISINVFTYEEETLVPLRITDKNQRTHHVNLLWLTYEDKSHYCLIKNLNRFLSRMNKHGAQMYFCSYCLHGFGKETSLQEHQMYCSRHGAQRIELPIRDENDILQFTDYEKTLKAPFVIYADTETIIQKVDTCQPNPDRSASTPATKLEICGFGYKVVCEDERYTKPAVIYRGKDAGRTLIECLLREEEEIRGILSNIEPMHITEEHHDLIERATECCLCKKVFTKYDKTYGRLVRHHSHVTGKILGISCNGCNLRCRQATFIPVLFHNLKHFDGHIIFQNVSHFKHRKLQCIAQNTENYVSFCIGHLRFIDSFQFLPSSLETLVDNLAQDGLQAFVHLRSETDDSEEAQLLLRKGVYPYEYMDSFEKFEELELPPREQFYSSIKKEHVSEEDYEHAQTVFKTFAMTSLGQYHDLYLKLDVVLLTDVFEAFRNLCLKQYELDPCHFYTSPGLSWSACLKMTRIRLELLTDIDMLLMVESGIRGGISQISNRYEKANNPYLEDYDPSKPSKYLLDLDANNLYGWAMIHKLPVRDFAFMDEREVGGFDVMSVPENGETGWILEVSLRYPKRLHSSHNSLPLAPVKRVISDAELSPYAQHLLRKLHGLSQDDPLPKRGKVEKLLTTLEDKDHYVLHYRNLQLYLSLGMEIKAIHRILKFTQEAWMKSYIDQNTRLRQQATSTFQKNFYKLMNVSVFGKTMENVRLHRNIELVHNETRLRKVAAKPTYKTSTIFNEDLVAVELYKTKVKLFKPIYCGMSILDLSKCLMYDFWYNYIKKKYNDKAQLQMTDTDSLLFACETKDIYADMKASIDYFDTSDYPREHFLQNDLNKKALGKLKDEMAGTPIAEFVGLRSKMYSFLCGGNREEKRAKGIAKVTVKKELKHDCYKTVLLGEKSMICSMPSLRSHRHELFGETIRKTGLSAFCDKRYLLDAVSSYAYGHYNIAKDRNGSESVSNDNQSVLIIPAEGNSRQFRLLEDRSFATDDFKITPCVKM